MHIPSNMTPQNVIDQIEIVVNRIAPKYTFYGYDTNDMKQEAFIICMEALPRYDEKRPLENFLSVHLSNRLKNFVRDNHFTSNEEQKAKVMKPGQLANEEYILDDDREENVESVDYKEMTKVLDIKLPAEYRSDYLKIVNDVYVPKKRKEEVLFIIEHILDEEARYITQYADELSVEEIAANLDRDPNSIQTFIKKKLKKGLSTLEQAAYELEERPYWIELEQQFTADELTLFKYHWGRIISQFKDDVFPTEELQVVDVIKLELLMNRCLKSNKENIDQITAFEGLVATEKSVDPDQQDRDYIINLERQIASLRAAQESLNRDYRDLQTKKSAMLKEMKGTREQRIKRLEDSKQTFTGWVAHLMQNPHLTEQYGNEMEKMRLAMEQEKNRLRAFHKYEDGLVDQPFLTPDTVED